MLNLDLDDIEPEQKQKLENICNFLMNEAKFADEDGDPIQKWRDFLYSRCHNLCWTVFTYYGKSKLWVPHNDILERLKYPKRDIISKNRHARWRLPCPGILWSTKYYRRTTLCILLFLGYSVWPLRNRSISQHWKRRWFYSIRGVDKRITNYYIN